MLLGSDLALQLCHQMFLKSSGQSRLHLSTMAPNLKRPFFTYQKALISFKDPKKESQIARKKILKICHMQVANVYQSTSMKPQTS
jgi:hypothetical protein